MITLHGVSSMKKGKFSCGGGWVRMRNWALGGPKQVQPWESTALSLDSASAIEGCGVAGA
jgi:hypothetical protein